MMKDTKLLQALVEFQFQDGSIKCKCPNHCTRIKRLFQFQDGSIKCIWLDANTNGTQEFQFQDGSIKWC